MASLDMHVVFAALKEGPPETASARTMLRDALPHAVAPIAAGTEPHPFQLRMLDAARQTFEELRSAGEAAKRVAADGIAAARTALAEAGAAVGSADAAVEEATAAADAAKAAKAEHAARVRAAEKDLAETELSTKVVMDLRAALVAELEAVRSVVEAVERAEGAGGGGPLGGEVAASMVTLLQQRRAEQALIAAVPASFAKPAATRHEFDEVVVREATCFVEKVMKSLQGEVDEGASEADNAEAERLGSWALLDVECDRSAELGEALTAAEDKLSAAKAARQAAEAEVGMRQDALSAQLVAETLADERLKELGRAAEALERLARPPEAVVVDDEEMPAAGEVPAAAIGGLAAKCADVPMVDVADAGA